MEHGEKMKLDDYDFEDDYEEDVYGYSYSNKKKFTKSSTFTYSLIVVSLCVLMTLILVFVLNSKNDTTVYSPVVSENNVNNILANAEYENSVQATTQREIDNLISGSTLTAQDLDIWDDEKPIYDATLSDNVVEETAVSINEAAADDPATDGRHTRIEHSNGDVEWIEINQYLDSSDYDYSNLVYQKPLMKYYENNRNVSFAGADIDKNNDYVDFNELKEAGIDFVMLRIGQRGYYTGEITIDDYFYDNLKRAQSAGLEVGVYFWSSAISEEEAVAEAEFVITTLSENKITYPVVFCMEDSSASTSRTDDLTQMQRTNIAIAFMDKIKGAGYYPMLMGNKEYLITKYSIGSLTKYDIWLDQVADIPDYPYTFQMWRYTNSGKIDGVAGSANLIISFIDYTLK